MSTIRFSCPDCGRSFSVDKSLSGQSAKCPTCHAALRVPVEALREASKDEAARWWIIVRPTVYLVVIAAALTCIYVIANKTKATEAALIQVGFVVFIAAVYFIPTVVARSRKHHNATAIFALNLFLGWTFLGWVASLVWALTSTPKSHS